MDDELSPGAPRDPAPYRFDHAGATIVVEEEGAGERTFLLVHGIGMGRRVFREITGLLSPHGLVIAMDLPGYGEAPEPHRTLTIERTADLLAAFLTQRRVRHVTLVGHSMGTQVVTEIAARHPHLAERIVLVAPTVDIAARSRPRQLLRLLRDIAVESPSVVAMGAREFLRAGPHVRKKMRAMLTHRPEDAYPRVTVPALVIRGQHDYVSPGEWSRFVVDLLPVARLAEIDGHGHETLIRDAAPAAERILAFVAEDPAGISSPRAS